VATVESSGPVFTLGDGGRVDVFGAAPDLAPGVVLGVALDVVLGVAPGVVLGVALDVVLGVAPGVVLGVALDVVLGVALDVVLGDGSKSRVRDVTWRTSGRWVTGC